MRYCQNLPNAGPCGDAASLAELAAVAEDAGWDGIFLEDYILYQGRPDVPTYDPWVCLAAMASRTHRIRLGTMVTPLTRRRPWKLAREAVTLDHLSAGRLTLGVGLGDAREGSFAAFGEQTNDRVRAAMLDEALAIVTGLWSGEPFSFQGRHYTVRDVTMLPQPLQQPRIPIWIGGAYPNAGPLRRALRWDGACFYHATARGSADDTSDPLTPAELRSIRQRVDRERGAGAPFDIMVLGARAGFDVEAEQSRLRASAAAGATWAMNWLPPSEPEAMRAAIVRGPVRAE